MFGMGTGGSLRLLSPERSGAPALRCRASSLRRAGLRSASRLPFQALASALDFHPLLSLAASGFDTLCLAPSKPHRLDCLWPDQDLIQSSHSLTNHSFGFASTFAFGSLPSALALVRSPTPYSLFTTPCSQDQALDRLVSSSSIHYCTSTDDLSTLSSSRGLTCF